VVPNRFVLIVKILVVNQGGGHSAAVPYMKAVTQSVVANHQTAKPLNAFRRRALTAMWIVRLLESKPIV